MKLMEDSFGGEQMVALTENEPIPNLDLIFEYKAYFLWVIPWFGDFVFNENFNSKEHLRKVYNHERIITLEKLRSLTPLIFS
ncbi:MAG: hypothetical protein ACPLKX_04950 [Dictyoglomaceae bacterium]